MGQQNPAKNTSQNLADSGLVLAACFVQPQELSIGGDKKNLVLAEGRGFSLTYKWEWDLAEYSGINM